MHCSSSTLFALIDSRGIDRDSKGEDEKPLPLPSGDGNQSSKLALIPDSDKRILQRLVRREVSRDELPSLIETIVSNMKAADIVECLKGNDAQIFIDVMDKVSHQTIPSLRNSFVDLFQLSNFHLLGVR